MNPKKNVTNNMADLAASIAKSAVGIVPIAGPMLSEIVGSIIPNQRIERLTEFVLGLDKKLSEIPMDRIKPLLDNSDFIDLFEEGLIQASRANSKERREYISSLIKNGITTEEIKLSESKFLLKILMELNDVEIIWLRSFLVSTISGDEVFREKHKKILEKVNMRKELDTVARNRLILQESYKKHLERVGVVYNTLKYDIKTNKPLIGLQSTEPVIRYTRITPLGKMLLKHIDLVNE